MNDNFTYELMPYGRVLLVEEQNAGLYTFKDFLALYELSVDTAKSGREALEKIKSGEEYDIIFMDDSETVEHLRSIGYEMPIVALTDFISTTIDAKRLNACLLRLVRDQYPPEIVKAAAKLRTKNNQQAKRPGEGVSAGVIAAFLKDAGRAVGYLETFADLPWTDEELGRFTTTAHGMKSALANIGEKELSEVALSLEKAGKNGSKALISQTTPVFLEKIQALILALSASGSS